MTRSAGVVAAALLLGGCAAGPQDRVVLMPGPDGQVGRIAVNPGAGETVLGEAWASARVDDQGRLTQQQATHAEVTQDFGAALAALPPRPKSYTLYFEADSDRLTEKSAIQAIAVLAEIAGRPVADVIVIGHTDSVGDARYNDGLSLQRAQALRDLLIEKGGDAARITVAGRGEREPLVPTDDEVPEPRNRRAELSVR